MNKLFENWRKYIGDKTGEGMTIIPGEESELYVQDEPTVISPSHGTKVKLAVQAARKKEAAEKAAAEKAEEERIKKIKDYAPEAVRQLANNMKAQKKMPEAKKGVGVIVPCWAGDCPDQMVANDHAPFWNAYDVAKHFEKAYPGKDKDSKLLRKTMQDLLATDAPGIFGQYKSSPGESFMYFGISGGKGRKKQRGVGTKIIPEMIIVHSSTTQNPSRTVSALGGRAAGLKGPSRAHVEPGGTDLKGAGHTLSTNFEIDHDGTIYEYFPAGIKTIHAGWTNQYSVGVDLTGKPGGHTAEQLDSLRFLIEKILDEFPNIPRGIAPQLSAGQFINRASLKRLRKVPFDKRYGVFSHVSVSSPGRRSDPGDVVMTGIGATNPSGELLTYLVMNNIAPEAGKGVSKEDLKAALLDSRAIKKMQKQAEKAIVKTATKLSRRLKKGKRIRVSKR